MRRNYARIVFEDYYFKKTHKVICPYKNSKRNTKSKVISIWTNKLKDLKELFNKNH